MNKFSNYLFTANGVFATITQEGSSDIVDGLFFFKFIINDNISTEVVRKVFRFFEWCYRNVMFILVLASAFGILFSHAFSAFLP